MDLVRQTMGGFAPTVRVAPWSATTAGALDAVGAATQRPVTQLSSAAVHLADGLICREWQPPPAQNATPLQAVPAILAAVAALRVV